MYVAIKQIESKITISQRVDFLLVDSIGLSLQLTVSQHDKIAVISDHHR